MITIMFFLLMAAVFGRLAFFAIKLAWGFTKVLFTLIFLPIILIVIFISGLIQLAFPVLLIVGIVSFFTVK